MILVSFSKLVLRGSQHKFAIYESILKAMSFGKVEMFKFKIVYCTRIRGNDKETIAEQAMADNSVKIAIQPRGYKNN